MTPQPGFINVRTYLIKYELMPKVTVGLLLACTFDNEQLIEAIERHSGFIRWLDHSWVELTEPQYRQLNKSR